MAVNWTTTVTEGEGTAALVFKRTSGSTTDIEWLILSTTKETIRSNQKWAAVTSIDFTVTDDDGYVAYYEDVNADSIADFASLSL